MTREEAIKFLTNKKVFVKDKSSEIQEKLFFLGIYWGGNSAKVQFEDAPFLYIGMNKGILKITFGSSVDYFYGQEYDEITVDDILNIVIDGANYRPLKEILKQEHLYRPFKDTKECWNEMLNHEPFGWLKHKENRYYNNCSLVYNGIDEDSFNDIYEDYTFADGTPFGIKED